MKMLVIFGCLLVMISIKARSQDSNSSKVIESSGVSFDQHLSWNEIFEKAKNENKYIFVDCYTTWCGPCKWMDQNIYTNDTVAGAMRRSFLAFKLQMDTTQQDADDIRSLYSAAHALGEQYHIRAYPSFLFFSPDGRAVHKAIGAKSTIEFLAMLKDAMDCKVQFYTMVDEYQHRTGNYNYDIMPKLAAAAKKVGEDSIASSVALSYMEYMANLGKGAIWSNENLAFLASNAGNLHESNRLFQRYFAERKSIDSALASPGKADGLINYVIYRDEVLPVVRSGIKDSTEPNWFQIAGRISYKYGRSYSDRNILQGKVKYYEARNMHAQYIKYFVQQMEASNVQGWPKELAGSFQLNNDAFEVFKYSQNKHELELALAWVNYALTFAGSLSPNELDTKANLLYKLGRRKEGLKIEAESVKLAPNDKEIALNFAKMKMGLPTW